MFFGKAGRERGGPAKKLCQRNGAGRANFTTRLLLFRANLGTALFEGSFCEKLIGKARIEATRVIKNLSGAAAIVFARDLERRPHTVLELVIRIDGSVFVDLLVFFVLGDDRAADQTMSATVHGQTERAALAVGQLDPIHLLEIHAVASAVTNGHARLLEAQPKQIVDAALDLLLKVGDGSRR